MPNRQHRILITGTGRCRTTMLVALFTKLGFDTGFNADKCMGYLNAHWKAGLEKNNSYICKAPIMVNKNMGLNVQFFKNYIVDHVIIPIRDLNDCAKSRKLVQGNNVGAINGGYYKGINNELEQYTLNAKYLGELIVYLVLNKIPFTFLRDPELAMCPEYLYEELNKAIGHLVRFPVKEDFIGVFKEVVKPELIRKLT